MRIIVDPTGLKQLEKQFERIGDAIVESLEEEMADMAMALYARTQEMAEERLKGKALEEYIDALSIREDNITKNIVSFTIRLAAPALKWEEGFPGFDMKIGLLSGPNATLGANGNRYNTVLFEHAVREGFKSIPKSSRTSVEKAIKMYGLDQIIRDSNNKILQGKVGTISDRRFGENMMGLTKYQKKVGSKTESSFMTFRRVSDASSSSAWWHPGRKGVFIFDDIEREAQENMDRLIKNFLK